MQNFHIYQLKKNNNDNSLAILSIKEGLFLPQCQRHHISITKHTWRTSETQTQQLRWILSGRLQDNLFSFIFLNETAEKETHLSEKS